VTSGDAWPEAEPPVALYVHVPFCVSLCPYCDFVVYAGAAARGPRSQVDAFLEALRVEIGLRADRLDQRFGGARPSLESVYLGGGTPSLLPADAVGDLLELVQRRFGVAPGAEITIEANPGPDERGDAILLRQAGVTRVSLGAQSLDDRELRTLGRRHRAADVEAAAGAWREAGIGSLSLDLLYDIPDASPARWSGTLEAALALDPDHLSLYALTLDDPDAEGLTGPAGDHLPTSAGARRWRASARTGQDEDRAAAAYLYATDRLGTAGWHGYEISNWAKPGHESRHNRVYWDRRPYEAVGPGAHAFDGATRRWNAANLAGYLAALRPSRGGIPVLPPGGFEALDADTSLVESVILALRTDAGVPAAAASWPRLEPAFAWATEHGLLVEATGARLALTTRGRLLSNELFARIV
jgi:oxygen-independent coproporphyrinogen-3 oxidase